MEVERAKAISDVAQTIINSAKVEVDMIRATNGRPRTGFIPVSEVETPKPRQALGQFPRR